MTSMTASKDQFYMEMALQLATKGSGNVSPNPMVGCVIVKHGEVIGSGYHEKYGQAHAEVNAVRSLKHENEANGADVYVTLEPCAHWGKTPPCAELLARLKPKRVIIAVIDTNPLVENKGVAILEKAGIEVTCGVLEHEARKINKRFFTFMELQRPFITLKWAESKDRFIGLPNGQPIKISNELAHQASHQLRASEDAILVGTNTAINDNPSLTTRLVEGKNPLRLFIDKNLKVPSTHHLLDGCAPTVCYNEQKNQKSVNIEYVKIDSQNYIENIIQDLYNRKITSLIVEGGAYLLQTFIDAGLWDEAIVFQSSNKLITGIKAPKLNITHQRIEELNDNQCYFYENT